MYHPNCDRSYRNCNLDVDTCRWHFWTVWLLFWTHCLFLLFRWECYNHFLDLQEHWTCLEDMSLCKPRPLFWCSDHKTLYVLCRTMKFPIEMCSCQLFLDLTECFLYANLANFLYTLAFAQGVIISHRNTLSDDSKTVLHNENPQRSLLPILWENERSVFGHPFFFFHQSHYQYTAFVCS